MCFLFLTTDFSPSTTIFNQSINQSIDQPLITMNPAISNLVLMLVMMQVSKRLDWENPSTILYVRILYVSATVITLSIYLITRQIIINKNDQTTLKYLDEPNKLSGETEKKLVTTTVKQYDIGQINQCIKGVFTGLAMTGFMHLYMKYTNPLLMQSLSPLKGAVEANIVKIHLFGKQPINDLARPFKAASLFGALDPNASTDKHSIEKAEVSGKGGVKEE
ncbi:Snd3 protein [Saccharomycopsis crataegensis]|uniref:Snd3 protein n=1 Tax=Saccharomycopsis crataegensis TaxID=43959 RepID=A0AAV5QLU8_9ASCO|nr:Snd3 protein [Saccharomycopsis crataegensis]